MSRKPRRIFTAEQKAEAVRIVEQSGKPISQVAREMGLTESALRRWFNQAQTEQSPRLQGKLSSAERQELTTLRRELKRVKQERDFLKKATAFFAKETTENSK